MSSDPLRMVWDALVAADCAPFGQPWDFRARCPVHGYNTSSLHVFAGVDGRAALWCFARQCDRVQIADAIGLTLGDLYPDGHYNARRRTLPDGRRPDFTGNARELVNVIYALERRRRWWRGELVADCPSCGSPNARLVIPSAGQPLLYCQSAMYGEQVCSVRSFTGALGAPG